MSPKNRIYTLIPEKSFAAFCRSETLDEVLSALITDEDEAADVVEEGTKVPHDAKDFVAIGSKAADAMLQTIATWLRRQDSTIKAQNQMFAWDPKVCLWTCARTVRIVGRELDGVFYEVETCMKLVEQSMIMPLSAGRDRSRRAWGMETTLRDIEQFDTDPGDPERRLLGAAVLMASAGNRLLNKGEMEMSASDAVDALAELKNIEMYLALGKSVYEDRFGSATRDVEWTPAVESEWDSAMKNQGTPRVLDAMAKSTLQYPWLELNRK